MTIQIIVVSEKEKKFCLVYALIIRCQNQKTKAVKNEGCRIFFHGHGRDEFRISFGA